MKKMLILWGWSVLSWFGVSKRVTQANHTVNKEVLIREKLWPQGGYIEKQSELEELRFGKAYTLAYGGCGLIALYNTLVALGEEPSNDIFLKLAEDLQRRGAAWGGKYGIHPTSIRRWFQKHGYKVQKIPVSEESFAKNEADYKVFVVTVLNGAGLKNWVHTVCITKETAGFVVHNGPYRESFATLFEAVKKSSRQGATAIYAMGVGSR